MILKKIFILSSKMTLNILIVYNNHNLTTIYYLFNYNLYIY